jgi:hypothetical protein
LKARRLHYSKAAFKRTLFYCRASQMHTAPRCPVWLRQDERKIETCIKQSVERDGREPGRPGKNQFHNATLDLFIGGPL